ncbi:hypothetical protein BCL76_11532 [Streptomyces sp. CG 926]|nr:hypothetical protein BCL76_11532 [Streptomyces sp. CG 926]
MTNFPIFPTRCKVVKAAAKFAVLALDDDAIKIKHPQSLRRHGVTASQRHGARPSRVTPVRRGLREALQSKPADGGVAFWPIRRRNQGVG